MQFASPKVLLNFFMGGNSSVFARNEGKKSRCRMIFTGSLLQLILKDQSRWNFDVIANNKITSLKQCHSLKYQLHSAPRC